MVQFLSSNGRKKKNHIRCLQGGCAQLQQLRIATREWFKWFFFLLLLFVIFAVAPICTHSKLSSLSTLLHDSPTAAFCSTAIQTCSKGWKKPCYDHFHPFKKQFVTSGHKWPCVTVTGPTTQFEMNCRVALMLFVLASISVNIFTRARKQRQTPHCFSQPARKTLRICSSQLSLKFRAGANKRFKTSNLPLTAMIPHFPLGRTSEDTSTSSSSSSASLAAIQPSFSFHWISVHLFCCACPSLWYHVSV